MERHVDRGGGNRGARARLLLVHSTPYRERTRRGSTQLTAVDMPAPRAASTFAADPAASDRERALWIYRTMLRIRSFDEEIVHLFKQGKIAGALHSYVGEEAVAAGVCARLRP